MAAAYFLPPNSIQLPFRGDTIPEGAVHQGCFAGEVLSPAEFFLTLSPDMDGFIRRMSDAYRPWTAQRSNFRRGFQRRNKPNAGELEPGFIVACINRNKTPQQEIEVIRAKIIRRFEMNELLGNEAGHVYRVLFLDLGVYDRVNLEDMYFLHRDFIHQPCWGIKCRFVLDRFISPHDVGFRNVENWNWPRATRDLMAEILTTRNARLGVRFVRVVKPEDPNLWSEDVWEVSIESVAPIRRMIEADRSVDEQIIELTIGNNNFFRLMQTAWNGGDGNILRGL